jgi:hypothetical protein
MGQKTHTDLDNQVAIAVSRLQSSFDALPNAIGAADAVAELEAIAQATGGELLFELPADHPNLGETQWAVLRYQQGGEDRFIHVFFSAAEGDRWIGQDSDAPREFAKFAHAWTDVLTRCVAELDGHSPQLPAAS